MKFDDFLAKDVKACQESHAETFASALITFLDAEQKLNDAKARVRGNYTGQYCSADFYAEEQEWWNRAADELAYVVKLMNKPNLVHTGPR